MPSPHTDPWIVAELEAAVAPYRGIWPEEAIAAFQREVLATLTSHPTMIRLLSEARPATADPSGEVRVTGPFTATPSRPRKTGST